MPTTDRTGFAVAANRLPVRWREDTEDWELSPGGLVTALRPVLQERSGTWVGWTGRPGHAPDPFTHDAIGQRPVPLSKQEIVGHYRGFCNATLWPLYHNAIRTPEYHRHWWRPHVAVNRRFAEAVAEALADDGTAWIHDYQLQLVPGFLRALRPRARIGFFLHIPFPPVELFGYLPWRRPVLRGLLGADVLAFQTRQGMANFVECASQYVGARPADDGLEFDGRRIRLQCSPISIDSASFEALARTPEVADEAASLQERLGAHRKILLGVDRLDYTKGIAVRLKAIETFFRRHDGAAEACAVLQIAVPTREKVSDYAAMREDVERLVGQINGEFGTTGHTPVTYLYRRLPPEDLVACYRAADVMMVTPLCDGMNLVAKEYVATRFDDTGVLILSEFAGAANELDDALLVNPLDADWMADRLSDAVDLSPGDARRRMAALRERVLEHDVFAWSSSCLRAIESAPQPA